MEIEDLFENKKKYGGHDRYKSLHHENGSYHGHSQHDHHGYDGNDSHYGKSRHGHDYNTMLQPFLAKLKSNPRLKFAIIAGGIVVLIVAVFIIIAVFPLLLNLLETLSKGGFQEILKIFTQ